MARKLFRGDAPKQQQKWRVKPPLNEGAVTFRIGNKSLSFDEWSAAAIVAAWNAATWPEFAAVTAAASGNDVILTADVAGEPFFVWVTVGDEDVGEGTGQNEVQVITLINAPTGGTFNVAFEGDDADVAYNISAADLQTALEGLSTLEAGDVTVTGSAGGPWTCTFAGRLAGQDVPALVVDGTNLTGGNAAAIINTLIDGGTAGDPETLTAAVGDNICLVDGEHSNSTTGILRLGYDTLSASDSLYHLLLNFTVALPQGTTIDTAHLVLPLGSHPSGELVFVVHAEDADDPSWLLGYDEAIGRPLIPEETPWNIPAGLAGSVNLTGLQPLLQALIDRPGWASGNGVNLHIRSSTDSGTYADINPAAYDDIQLVINYLTDSREIQTVTLSGNPRSGTVELTLDTETTAALDHDSTASEVEAALEALSNVGSGNVQCTGGPWPSTITCSFDVSLGNLPEMTATDTLVNGSVQMATSTHGGPAIDIEEEQRSRGPNHLDDELNWQDELGNFALPNTADEIFIPVGKVDALYGTRWKSAFTADAATNRLLVDGQCALRDGQKVRVVNSGGGLPAGLAAATDYYVRDRDGVFLRLSASLDGAPIDITTAGTGTHYVGVKLALFETDARYTGKLGLPRRHAKDFEEYRPRFLDAWFDSIRIGKGDGGGSARAHLDSRGMATTLQLVTSGGGTGGPAVQWLGDGTGNNVEVLGGELGIAVDPDEAAKFDGLKVRSGSVLIGREVECGNIERTGGSVRVLGAAMDGTLEL